MTRVTINLLLVVSRSLQAGVWMDAVLWFGSNFPQECLPCANLQCELRPDARGKTFRLLGWPVFFSQHAPHPHTFSMCSVSLKILTCCTLIFTWAGEKGRAHMNCSVVKNPGGRQQGL